MTKEELIVFLDRPTSNEDLDFIDYIMNLQQENKKLKGRIDTVRNMLWSIENCTLTRERLNQLDEELLGDK